MKHHSVGLANTFNRGRNRFDVPQVLSIQTQAPDKPKCSCPGWGKIRRIGLYVLVECGTDDEASTLRMGIGELDVCHTRNYPLTTSVNDVMEIARDARYHTYSVNAL